VEPLEAVISIQFPGRYEREFIREFRIFFIKHSSDVVQKEFNV
jgi:hypothetical protein